MSLHKEISFETEICQHLASNGWLFAEGDAATYDRVQALFPADVLAWVQATQPQALEILAKNHGDKAVETLLARLRDQLDQRGTLDVLRHGIELLGLKQPLQLAQFKPALAINPDILARYAENRLRVVRQVKYSLHNENCIDLVLWRTSNSGPMLTRSDRFSLRTCRPLKSTRGSAASGFRPRTSAGLPRSCSRNRASR
jgi:type I restriction enzyme R subunit